MSPLLLAVVLLLVALVGARLAFPRRQLPLGPRIVIATGGPFVLLGFLLGPHVAHVLSRETIELLTPLLALGLGWIGVLFGLQLDRDHLARFPGYYLGLAWLQAIVAFAVVYAVGRLILSTWLTLEIGALVAAGAATACVSTPAAVAMVSNTYFARGRVSRFLFYAGSLDGAVGIVALGLIHAFHYTGSLARGAALSSIEWLAMSVLLGLFFGTLFLSLTRIRPSGEELMVLLIGLVTFAAGTAFYLSVSPLFVCMLAGIMIANLSPLRRRVYAALSDWEKPIYILTLVLAGSLLTFSSWLIVPLVAAYVAGRILAKWLGGAVAHRFRPLESRLPSSFGLALVPQGGITLAMAISFFMIYDPSSRDPAAPASIFLATVVLGVGVTDLLGPFLIREILRRAGELDPGTGQARAAGSA